MTAESVPAVSTAAPSTAAPSTRTSRTRAAAVLGLSALIVAAATTVVSVTALALGADATFAPLHPMVYLSFAIPGLLAAVGGWVLVVRFVRRSARALTLLVPVLLVLSFIPDIALLIIGFIPGATVTGVVALMLMHPIVAVSAVLAGRSIAAPR